MDAVTYPDDKVIDIVHTKFVPVRIPADRQPLAGDFNITWTPVIIILNEEGREHTRTIGFFSPEEFVPSLMLRLGKLYLDAGRFDEAGALFNRVLSLHPKSHSAPEALYFRGVLSYKTTHEAKPLKEAYEQLLAQYPGSEWVSRASPYRLL